MKKYDLSIVGASFAGLSAAKTAALGGCETIILERKPTVKDKIHTTGILVKEILEQWNVPTTLVKQITGIRLYSPSLDWVDLESPEYSFYTTDTANLMQWYAQDVKKYGVNIKTNTNYRGSYLSDDYHVFPFNKFKSRFVLGCDGARSSVAKNYQLGKNKHFLIGAEAEYETIDDIAQNRLHVFLDSEFANGYIGWIAPGVECTQVGLASKYPSKLNLHGFIKKLHTLFKFDQAELLGYRGGLIPCGGVVKPYYKDNVMLIGDAAGMVSPLTAGGIHPAIEIGRYSGEAISQYLYDGDLRHIHSLKSIIPNYQTKQLMRWIHDHIHIPNKVYDVILTNPVFRSVAQTVFFHHRGLLTFAAWRDLVRTLQN